jgi:serine/threonine protein kinase
MITGKRNVIGAEPGMVLSWAERVNIALSAATGLEFLHKKARPCIVHGHIKSSNILLFGSDVAKIGGIGVSHAPSYIDNTFLDRLDGTPSIPITSPWRGHNTYLGIGRSTSHGRICSGYESPEYLLKDTLFDKVFKDAHLCFQEEEEE